MSKTKSFVVKNRDLGIEIQKAEQGDGYLICITRKNGSELRHAYFTQTFPREDIPNSLKKHEELLKRELSPTLTKEVPKVEKQKELPPEYRNK